jgi:diadenosine tetraphosphate (Ap4A) HIT family hydrolase
MGDPAWLSDPVGFAERGENPSVIARMSSGFAVFSVSQFLPGYCLLLAVPHIARLEDMPRESRSAFLNDMGLLGEAVAKVRAPRRINYSIYGNTAPYVHAHVVPRYDWEPAERVVMPIWQYPATIWTDPEHAFNEAKYSALREKIAAALKQIAE